MSYGLGVDLGTSFTRAAISRGGPARMVALADKSILLPSVVKVAPDGTLTAGDAGHPDDDPTRIGRDFKRRVGDPTPLMIGGQPHSSVALMAATLKSVIATLTEAEGEPPSEVVLTYPAVWGPYRREHFIEVPRQAGVENITVLTEPEAAASHYAARQQLSNGDVVAVYDLGGGTFDTAVARRTKSGLEVIGIPEGVEWVGGIDFDEAVLAHVDREVGGAFSTLDPQQPAAAIALRRIREECIRAKERLSREEATNIPVMLPHRHTQVRITRAQFESMITPSLEATLAALRRTLDSASVTPADLAGVLLVGGSSRIPLVSRMLSQDLGRPVLVDPHPQHCVALGAGAIAGRRLAAKRPAAAPRRIYRPSRRTLAAAAAVMVLVAGGSYLFTDRSSPDRRRPSAGLQSSPIDSPTPGGTSTVSDLATPTPSSSRTGTGATAGRTTAPDRPGSNQSSARPTARTTTGTTASDRSRTLAEKTPSLPRKALVRASEGSCLDVANGLSENGREVQAAACNGSPAQIWSLRSDRTFQALDKCMQAMTPLGARPTLQLQDCTASAAQRWRVRGSAIINADTGLCLALAGTETGHGTPLTVNSCTGRATQKWSLAG